MTKLTQSDLDDLRQMAKSAKLQGWYLGAELCDALDHIAQLTAERDDVRSNWEGAIENAVNDHKEWCAIQDSDRARIAELEAQPSAQFVAGMRRAASLTALSDGHEPTIAKVRAAILAEAELKGEE